MQDNSAITWLTTNVKSACFFFFQPISFGKYGLFRKNFLKESLDCLSEELEKYNHTLYLHNSDCKSSILEICKNLKIKTVVITKEYTHYEVTEEDFLKNILKQEGIELLIIEQSTLLNISDLTFDIQKLPLIFTDFRKKVEPLNIPLDSKPYSLLSIQPLKYNNNLASFDWTNTKKNPLLKGGATAGQARLKDYIWNSKSIETYKNTRNGMIRFDDTSKFSCWLSNGSLSSRQIYHEVKKYETEVIANDSTYWMIFELLWRDYFKFLALRFKEKIFTKSGIQNKDLVLETAANQEILFKKWSKGETDSEFINANMRELNLTGWMSNRGRQNVASYLGKNLQVDWTRGADWFEKHLIDYDPASNWGNWSYLAGVGTDPRDRKFNVESQIKAYDPNGDYQKLWK